MKSIPVLKPVLIKYCQLFLIFLVAVCLPKPYESRSNPVAFPLITEILFTADGYNLELLIWDMFGEPYLDNYRIVGLQSTGFFLPGKAIPPDGIVVVSQDDFAPEFIINPEGDVLYMEHWDGYEWQNIDYVPMIFGEVPEPHQSWVSAQKGGESVAYQIFYGMPMSECWAVKELPHSIGSDPMEVTLREEFSGMVRNNANQPLPYITLKYCEDWYPWSVPELVTDAGGYFYTDSMFCRKYKITFLNGLVPVDSAFVFVEPDSANYFEFSIDYLPTSAPEITPAGTTCSIRVIPNPAGENVRFIVDNGNNSKGRKGVIKIFNPDGIIVRIIPVELKPGQQEEVLDPGIGGLSPGIYICNLEIDRRKQSTARMILAR